MVWKWKEREIEEVKKFKYLGYICIICEWKPGRADKGEKKNAVMMREVWTIGKRKFEKDWARRMWLG